MHKFDYSFLKELSLSTEFAARLVHIEKMRNGSRSFVANNPDTAKDMNRLSKIMSVRESNAIEGISTEDGRLIKLLTGKIKPIGHNEYEILGYSEALEKIHLEYDSMNVDEETILDLFSILVSHTNAPSDYKRYNNEVVEKDAESNISRRFKTVPASKVEDCMYQLIGAFNEARNDFGIPSILLIPCFILDFLRIHPFADGNGRMSRLLTVLLLYQEGFDVCAYVSIESVINSSKMDYYDALAASEEGWFDNVSDYTPFIDYMIGVLFLAYREMDRRIGLCIGKDNKENRIERFVANVSVPISKSEILALMPDVSESYVESVLNRMLSEGRIERIGAKKSSRYLPIG